jgi:hypothetical protein
MGIDRMVKKGFIYLIEDCTGYKTASCGILKRPRYKGDI